MCDSIPQIRILPIKSPDEMAINAQRFIDQGYQYLKIKVDGHITEDVERVRAIREQVGPDIHLTIDANQSYHAKSAIQAIRWIADEKFKMDFCIERETW
ncbi:enolase C-terminal domain-like protein [Thermodesulfobacteriota bacterium]